MKLKLKSALIAAALAVMTATLAKADAVPGNDSGSFTVRITPNVDLGVIVDTTGSAWVGSANLDVTQDLGTDKLLGTPIGIAMAGNFAKQELTLTGVALNTWVLNTDEVNLVDTLRLYAMFGRFGFAASPIVADFAGAANLIKVAATRAGQVQANEGLDAGHVYELPLAHAEYGAGAGDVDDMLPTATRKLWLRSTTPATTTTSGQAAFTVTVTAVTGVGL